MDYNAYKKIDFRRKYWKFLGVDISVTDPNSGDLIGFINQKTIQLRPDVFVYTDKSMNQSIVELKKQTLISSTPKYSIIDTQSHAELGSLQFNDFKSYFMRWHIRLCDPAGTEIGYIQETSSALALLRRWMGIISDLLELILAFVPQTFSIYQTQAGSGPQLVGTIVHRKNPFIVKMSLDLTRGQATFDPKLNFAICTLLCLRDISKNA